MTHASFDNYEMAFITIYYYLKSSANVFELITILGQVQLFVWKLETINTCLNKTVLGITQVNLYYTNNTTDDLHFTHTCFTRTYQLLHYIVFTSDPNEILVWIWKPYFLYVHCLTANNP